MTVAKFCLIITIFLIICYSAVCQNLVPNYSFETYTQCPNSYGTYCPIETCVPWVGTNQSSDYYNKCDSTLCNVPNRVVGFQRARTGNVFAGQFYINGYTTNSLTTNYREFIQS